MWFSSNEQLRQTSSALCLGLTLTFATTVPVFADGPWLSGASTMAIGEKVIFSGGGFAPSAALTIQITDAQGGAYTQSVVADASGAVVYEITPSVSGSYNLTVIDGNGTPLATTSFGAF